MKGEKVADREAAAATPCAIYLDRHLQRFAGWCDRCGFADSSDRSELSSIWIAALLPSQAGERENQQAPTAGTDSRRGCSPICDAGIGSHPETKHFVEFNGKPVSSREDGVQERRAARRARERGLAAHAAAHRSDLADADGVRIRGKRLAILGMCSSLAQYYGHHHPDYLSDAVEKIAQRETKRNERTFLVR